MRTYHTLPVASKHLSEEETPDFYNNYYLATIKLVAPTEPSAYGKTIALPPLNPYFANCELIDVTAYDRFFSPPPTKRIYLGHGDKIGNLLGKGQFSQVFAATYQGQAIALKQVDLLSASRSIKRFTEADVARCFEGEVALLQKFHHRNIVRFLGILSKDHHDYLAMELCDYSVEDLFLKKPHLLTPELRFQIILQIAKVLVYIHTLGVAHGDLKSSNILLKNSQVKVIDFGLSDSNVTDIRYRLVGEDTSPKSDIFSFGIIMYSLLIIDGAKPSKFLTPGLIIEELFPIPPDSICPAALADLMRRCWRRNPHERPTAKIIIKRLNAFKKIFSSKPKSPIPQPSPAVHLSQNNQHFFAIKKPRLKSLGLTEEDKRKINNLEKSNKTNYQFHRALLFSGVFKDPKYRKLSYGLIGEQLSKKAYRSKLHTEVLPFQQSVHRKQ